MTLTIEVDDDKALNELKDFLGSKKEIRLVEDENNEINMEQSGTISQTRQLVEDSMRNTGVQEQEAWGPKQQAEMMALSGSLNMKPERFKEYEKFLHDIRNEWE